MTQMVLSTPRSEYPDIFVLRPVIKLIGIDPVIHSDTWADSIDIIALNPVFKNYGLTQ